MMRLRARHVMHPRRDSRGPSSQPQIGQRRKRWLLGSYDVQISSIEPLDVVAASGSTSSKLSVSKIEAASRLSISSQLRLAPSSIRAFALRSKSRGLPSDRLHHNSIASPVRG